MRGETLEVVLDGDARGRARVEAGQTAVPKRDLVIEADELHQHARDENDKIMDIDLLVSAGEDLGGRLCWSQTFGWRLCDAISIVTTTPSSSRSAF